MKTLSVQDAKAHLSRLLEEVLHGEEIVISRHGRPVAKLVPLRPAEERPLGFHPIAYGSDLAAPTDTDILEDFEGARP